MNKSDILELKKRMKKDKCAFNRIAGCCIGNEKEILATFNRRFLTLDDGDLHKFLDIASKTLSGKPGNNLLELNFPTESEKEGGAQYRFMQLRNDALMDEDMLMDFYQDIIDQYEHTGKYAILLFHDTYDVPCKGTDKRHQGESEEVYSYIICAICPIDLTKPGLGVFDTPDFIRERTQDWVLSAPETGFIFPAFNERSADIHATMYYMKTPKKSQPEFVSSIFECDLPQTSDEKQEAFTLALSDVLENEDNPPRLLYDINESLRQLIETSEDVEDPDTGEVIGTRPQIEDMQVTESVLEKVLLDNELPEEKVEQLQKAFEEKISGDTSVDQILNRKLLETEKHRRREEDLLLEIAELKKEIERLKKLTK